MPYPFVRGELHGLARGTWFFGVPLYYRFIGCCRKILMRRLKAQPFRYPDLDDRLTGHAKTFCFFV